MSETNNFHKNKDFKMSEQDDSLSEIIEKNAGLVIFTAKKYYNQVRNNAAFEDLVSIGSIGLIKAVHTFDASKKVKLSTYATKCIENEILMYLRRTSKQQKEVPLNEDTDFEKNNFQFNLQEEDIVWDAVEQSIDKQHLQDMIKELSPLQRKIVGLRFGLDGNYERTQQEAAKILGISQSYLSKIEKKIIRILKSKIE
ncbi:MAG: sigma-70 family RNA polymerase sigma factor [Christensenellaceae bacterium]